MRELVEEIDGAAAAELEPYLRRGDFSRWIGDVFGDHSLARELRTLESRAGRPGDTDMAEALAAAIRARYDLAPDEDLRLPADRPPP